MRTLCAHITQGEKLGLQHPSDYKFLKASGCYEVTGRDDTAEYEHVIGAMQGLGFSEVEISEILAFLSGILLVGNLTFKDNRASNASGGCIIQDTESAKQIATLWSVTAERLSSSFTSHTIEVRGESLSGQLRASEAVDGCAAAAKHVYGALFSHIVRRVNELLDGPRGRNVGILDIFGFEIFECNSFEQLCINFANEKLQQLFCLHTFKQEEALYVQEEVAHEHIEFIDNQPVLSLIEGRAPAGLLMCLDDEAWLGPKGSDEGFMRNVGNTHGKSKLLQIFGIKEQKAKGLTPGVGGFSIEHYAGACKCMQMQCPHTHTHAATRARTSLPLLSHSSSPPLPHHTRTHYPRQAWSRTTHAASSRRTRTPSRPISSPYSPPPNRI